MRAIFLILGWDAASNYMELCKSASLGNPTTLVVGGVNKIHAINNN